MAPLLSESTASSAVFLQYHKTFLCVITIIDLNWKHCARCYFLYASLCLSIIEKHTIPVCSFREQKCRYEIQKQKEVTVRYTGIYHSITINEYM
jgi:hypothetical protein